MRKIILAFVLLGILGEAYNLWSHREGNRSNLKYYFGMVPGSYMLKEFATGGSLTLSYWVKMNFPAEPVIGYYGERLGSKGWAPFGPESLGPQRKWTYGIRVDPGSSVPACAYTYLAAWVNRPRDKMTQLTLLYYDPSPDKVCPPGPRNNELLVILQEIPFKP